MSIGEVLSLWAELEPNLCGESEADSSYWHVGNSRDLIDPDALNDEDLGIILMTVIAALEARDWEWELSGVKADERTSEPVIFYHAEVYRGEQPSAPEWIEASEEEIQRIIDEAAEAQANNAAEALLKAYLDALKAYLDALSLEMKKVSTPS